MRTFQIYKIRIYEVVNLSLMWNLVQWILGQKMIYQNVFSLHSLTSSLTVPASSIVFQNKFMIGGFAENRIHLIHGLKKYFDPHGVPILGHSSTECNLEKILQIQSPTQCSLITLRCSFYSP